MTLPADRASHSYPDAGMSVLVNRTLRPDADVRRLSTFADSQWSLSPAIFEDHYTGMTLNFGKLPDQYVTSGKHYLWAELNIVDPPMLKRSRIPRQAVYTHMQLMRRFSRFVTWLAARGIHRLPDVTAGDYDAYLADLKVSGRSYNEQAEELNVVRRLWAFRQLLPPQARLPDPAPWDGNESGLLLGPPPRARSSENRTPRIQAATMEPLLAWSIRFAEDFACDIAAVVEEVRPFYGPSRGRDRRARHPHRSDRRATGGLYRDITTLIRRLRAEGRSLPGKRNAAGELVLDYPHLAKLLDSATQGVENSPHRHLFTQSGLPIVEGAPLHHRVKGRLGDQPWLAEIDYHDVEALARILIGACFVVISYLSGARPGEKRAELHLMKHSARSDTGEAAVQRAVRRQLAA